MIQTSMQLKAKIRNISNGNSKKAQTLIRNYMMERFLERCSLSKYRDNFILKGGMFVSFCVGLESRATMDIDTTVQALPLTLVSATKIIQEIIDFPLDDCVTFEIESSSNIMEEHDYPGLRFLLNGFLDRVKQPIKIDISTYDAITPGAREYQYPLMFEDRFISILAYNIETVLGEKMETVLSRAEANTRMRDFYDIFVLLTEKNEEINDNILKDAFASTCRRRNSINIINDADEILSSVNSSDILKKQWDTYRMNNYYVGNLEWQDVFIKTIELSKRIGI